MDLLVSKGTVPKKHLAFILIAFVLIVGTGFGVAYYIFKETVRETVQVNQNTAQFLAKLIFEHQKATLGIIQSYSFRPLLVSAVKGKDARAILPHLKNLVEKNPEIEQVFVAGKEGILWANYPPYPESIGKDYSKRDWYQGTSKEWAPYVSEVFKRNWGDKDLVLVVCTPIFDHAGNVLGILGTQQRTLLIAKLAIDAKIDPDLKITLVDRIGQVIFSDKFEYQKQIIHYQPFTLLREDLERGGKSAEIEDPYDGTTKYVSFAFIKELGWAVFTERGKGEVIGSRLFEFMLIGGISLILCALVIGGSIYLIQKEAYLSELRHLSSQILDAQEKERKRIANELHDSLLSELAGVRMSLESKILSLKNGQPPDLTSMEWLMALLQNAMQDTRAIMNNLRPPLLDELGIISTLNWYCREFNKTRPHICIEHQIQINEGDVDDSLKIVIFRVFQEATNNFHIHGNGTTLKVTLVKKEGDIELEIQDDGQGFNLNEVPKGVGLTSMRERVESSGGKFQIDTEIGKGTTIKAIWKNS